MKNGDDNNIYLCSGYENEMRCLMVRNRLRVYSQYIFNVVEERVIFDEVMCFVV